MNQDELTQKEIKDAQAKQATKDVVDTAGKVAAEYLAPGVGGKIYDMAASTKEGQKILNTASERISKVPGVNDVLSKAQPLISQAKPGVDMALGSKMNSASQAQNATSSSGQLSDKINSSKQQNNSPSSLGNNKNISSFSGGEDSEIKESSDSAEDSSLKQGTEQSTNSSKNHLTLIIIVALILSFLLVFIPLIYVLIFVTSPISAIGEFVGGITNFGDHLLNFLGGCGWSSSEECETNKLNNFYLQVKNQSDYYKSYSIELDTNLIIATLTYSDPFLTGNSDATDSAFSTIKNFKKTTKIVSKLVGYMVEQVGERCYLNDKFGKSEEISCSEKHKYNQNGKLNEEGKYLVIVPIYELTMDEYREKLENEFVIAVYRVIEF